MSKQRRQGNIDPVNEAVEAFKNVRNYEKNLDLANLRLRRETSRLTDEQFQEYYARTEEWMRTEGGA